MTAYFACATFHLNCVEKVAEKGAVPQLGSLLFSHANLLVASVHRVQFCMQICKCARIISGARTHTSVDNNCYGMTTYMHYVLLCTRCTALCT